MNVKPSIKEDPTTPKHLCNLGIAISLSEGRRLAFCLPEQKLERIIEEAEQKQKEKQS